MNNLTHVQLLDAAWKEAHEGIINGNVAQYIRDNCIDPFVNDIDNFISNPQWVKYDDPPILYRTEEGERIFEQLKERWSSGQAVALDIARTKIIPPDWNNIVKRVTTVTEHIDQGKNIATDREVQIRLRKGKEAIVITMHKNKIIDTNFFYES